MPAPLSHRQVLLCLAAALSTACPGASTPPPASGLDARLAQLAQEYKLVSLTPPLAGFRTGQVYYGPGKPVETGCWSAGIDSLRSFTTLAVQDSATAKNSIGVN